MTMRTPSRGLSRSKVFAVLLALLCVGVMAAALRVSESRGEYQVLWGRLGQPVEPPGAELAVDQVLVGQALSRDREITGELFVLATVRIAATGPVPSV
jgi:hypothetical protein